MRGIFWLEPQHFIVQVSRLARYVHRRRKIDRRSTDVGYGVCKMSVLRIGPHRSSTRAIQYRTPPPHVHSNQPLVQLGVTDTTYFTSSKRPRIHAACLEPHRCRPLSIGQPGPPSVGQPGPSWSRLVPRENSFDS